MNIAVRFVGILCLAAAGCARAADLDIAFIGTLSGAKASAAQDELDGFQLAVRHLGGRLGGVEFSLSIIDVRDNAEVARQTAASLWQTGHVRIVLLSAPEAAVDLVAQQAAQHRSLVLNLGPAPATLAGRECNANFFSLAVRGDTDQEQAGQYLQGQGYRHLAVLEPVGHGTALAALRRGFKGEVVEIKSRPGGMDFSSDLQRLKDSGADAAYLLLNGGMAVEFLLQYAAADLKEQFPLFGPADLFDQTVLAASSPAGFDLFSVASWSDDLDSPMNHRLVGDFEAEYGRPVSSRAAVGYDAAMLLDAAIRAVDRKIGDIEVLRPVLKRIDFPSTRGGFRFDNDQFPLLSYWVRQVAADQRGRMITEQRGILQQAVRDSEAHDCPMRAADPAPPAKPH